MEQASVVLLGEAVGKLYVAEYFPAESKAKMEELVAPAEAIFLDAEFEAEWDPEPRGTSMEQQGDGGRRVLVRADTSAPSGTMSA